MNLLSRTRGSEGSWVHAYNIINESDKIVFGRTKTSVE